ncbi:MAG: adenylate cyclase [Ideonella sp.]|nr:adenylate cyclase [Ideonella sp.]
MATETPAETPRTAAPVKRKAAAKAAPARKAAKAATTEVAKPLSGEDVMRIIQLGKGSNSVELKLSIPMGGHRATVRSIGLDPVEAQPRQAFYFDTPDLALNRAGVVVRARRIQGGRADTVVKLRPVEPDTIDPELRRSAAFKVEVDVMPGGYVCSASYKGLCTGREVQDVADGTLALSKILSKEQRAFFRQHAPSGVTLDQLVVLGPTFLLKAKHQPKNFDRPLTIEVWFYPDDTRILEVSTKCLPEETFNVGHAFRTYLADRGIALGAKQEPKTKTAIDFFGAMLRQVAG